MLFKIEVDDCSHWHTFKPQFGYAMRGFAISLLTLARVESLDFFPLFLCDIPQS
jgi:hypothetical protein